MSRYSTRIHELKESSTLTFSALARDLKQQGVDVIAMTAGEPDFQPPEHVLRAAHEAIDRGLTKYTATEGTLELRTAIVGKFRRENGLEYGTDQISVSTGGKQVLYNAFAAVLNPGDEVIVPAPYWVTYPAQVELMGAVTVDLPTRAENGFVPDPDELESLITPRTKVILVNSPNNPTGAVYPEDVIRRFAEIAEKHDIWLFTDDLYEHLVYDGEFTPLARYAQERTLVIHGASKGYALTGWRLGYGAGPRDLVKLMNKVQSQVTSGANAVAQHATIAALDETELTAEFLRRTTAAYRERRDVLVAGLNSLGLQTPMPQGAFYVMPDVSAIHADENEAALRLLGEAHVATVPGTDFRAPGRVRMSYATSLENVKEALTRIEKFLQG